MTSFQRAPVEGNQFYLVNAWADYGTAKITPNMQGDNVIASLDGFNKDQLFTFEKVNNPSYPGSYIWKSVVTGRYQWKRSWVATADHVAGKEFYWNLEVVNDYIGDEWDEYYIKSFDGQIVEYVYGQPYFSMVRPNKDKWSLWRLVPRYMVEDEGYIELRRHAG